MNTEEPLFVGTGTDTPHDDEKIIERNAITSIVRDPKDGKYLLLHWQGEVTWKAFITGGIEEDQTAEEAARAEVREETGYTNLRLVSNLPRYNAKFWHGKKKVNRLAHFQCFLFELENDEKEEVVEEELALHKALWLSQEELEALDLNEGNRFLLNHILNSKL